MKRPLLVAAALVVLVAAGVGIAFVSDLGPSPGGAGGGATTTAAFPTQTPPATTAPDDGGGATSVTTTAGPDGETEPFAFTIDRVDDGGTTWRDVTSTLTNRQSEGATGVTVYSRIFVGNSTDSADEIWRGEQAVGALGPGESFTATRRVELSYSEAFAVQQAGGWITVQTTIRTDQQTLTYAERRNVL